MGKLNEDHEFLDCLDFDPTEDDLFQSELDFNRVYCTSDFDQEAIVTVYYMKKIFEINLCGIQDLPISWILFEVAHRIKFERTENETEGNSFPSKLQDLQTGEDIMLRGSIKIPELKGRILCAMDTIDNTFFEDENIQSSENITTTVNSTQSIHDINPNNLSFQQDILDLPHEKISPEIILEVPLSTSIPKFPGKNFSQTNCWSHSLPHQFKVRGKTYLDDKIKIPSQKFANELLGIDLLLCDSPPKHISITPGSFVQRMQQELKSDCPFLWVFNFVLPWASFVAYFRPMHGGISPFIGDEAYDRLIERFINGSDESDEEFRRRRLKIIPSCVEGPLLVKSAVGSKPAIVGTKIDQRCYKGNGYFEVSIDITSSKAAGYILKVVRTYVSKVSIGLAFVIEGQCEEELPERILGALVFHKLDLVNAPTFDQWTSR